MRRAFPNIYNQPEAARTHRTSDVDSVVQRLQRDVPTIGYPLSQAASSHSSRDLSHFSQHPSVSRDHQRNGHSNRISPYTLPFRFSPHRNYNCTRRQPTSSKPKPGRKFNRSVVIVDSSDKNIPRGPRRHHLHSKGLVVSFIDFWTGWTEDEVINAIEEALVNIIDLTQPFPR